MTAAELPTARLRQLRDGHDPDDAHHGRARTNRITKLQQQIVDCDELATELGRYRCLAAQLGIQPAVRGLVDREIGRMIDRTVSHRVLLARELRALQ